METRPKISFIIPSYNSERYIARAIDSVLDQELNKEEYEIIIVNDGSTDGSLEICTAYAAQNDNIKIITQENQGVSVARNTGLDVAKGRYIQFLDSDDTLVAKGIKYLLNHFEIDHYDLIRFWVKLVYGNNKEIDSFQSIKQKEMNGLEFIKLHGLETFCYTSLYRLDYLKEKKLYFHPLTLGEDFLFASSVLLTNPKILSTSCPIYNYIIRPGSVSTSRTTDHLRKCIQSQIEANRMIVNQTNKLNLAHNDPQIYHHIYRSLEHKMPIIMSRILSSSIPFSEVESYLKECKDLNILPMKRCNRTLKEKIISYAINAFVTIPKLILPIRWIYKNLFLKLIYPHLDRNN